MFSTFLEGYNSYYTEFWPVSKKRFTNMSKFLSNMQVKLHKIVTDFTGMLWQGYFWFPIVYYFLEGFTLLSSSGSL